MEEQCKGKARQESREEANAGTSAWAAKQGTEALQASGEQGGPGGKVSAMTINYQIVTFIVLDEETSSVIQAQGIHNKSTPICSA